MRSMTVVRLESARKIPLGASLKTFIATFATVCLIPSIALVAFTADAQTSTQSGAVSPLMNTPAAVAQPPAPLPVDEAFASKASWVDGKLVVHLDVLPGHYLYRERFEVSTNGKAQKNLGTRPLKGKLKDDANFGRVEVFEQPVTIAVEPTTARDALVTLTYQGCSELAGVCYPPVKRTFQVPRGGKNIAANEAAKPTLGSIFKKNVSQQ